MGVFRKRPKGFVSPPSENVLIHSLERVEEATESGIIKSEVVVPMSTEEFISRHPPLKEEFTLLEQLQAGVSVKDVPSAGLLDSSDNLDYEENVDAEEKVLSALESDINKE